MSGQLGEQVPDRVSTASVPEHRDPSGRPRRWGKLLLLLIVATALVAFFVLDLDSYLTFANLKMRQDELSNLLASNPAAFAAGFFLLYVLVTALSLPGAAIMTIAAGAVFGLVEGTVLVSFASTIGATLAFLASRYLFRDSVESRFGERVKSLDEGISRDGAFYLLTLRLMPVFPFFLVNLAMGLTAIRVLVFAIVSQIGMLPGTILFVNAGTQLATLTSASDVLSPKLIGSFVLLGLFPLLAKAAIGFFRRRRVYKGYKRPNKFDRNLIVIGAGAGGLVTSYIAATVNASVTLIESNKMGGDCLNTGCVPSKALIRAARLAQDIRSADTFGFEAMEPKLSFKAVMARVRSVIETIEPADSVERYTKLGVDVRIGRAKIVDPWTVEIENQGRVTARSIVIAAGADPLVPDIPGLSQTSYLTSETLWDAFVEQDAPPARLVILGGGPIGTELAQAFVRLGSKVTLLERSERILGKEDPEVSAFLSEKLKSEGVDIRCGHDVVRCEGKSIIARSADGEVPISFDELIVALGRKPRLTGYGLEELGLGGEGKLDTNKHLQTRIPNIYAVGDVAGPYQFTHAAAHEAWFAAVNALFGSFRKFKADYSFMPWVTYTDPEVAHVGHNELSAAGAKIEFEVVRFDLSHLDRAVAEGANSGFVKILVKPKTDRILGVTIVSANAGELIAEFVLAMKHKIGLNKILSTIHAYPTLSEANKYAAGEWKKAHKPERLLRAVGHYHKWRLG